MATPNKKSTGPMRPYAISIDDARRAQIKYGSDELGIPQAEIYRRMVDHWASGKPIKGLPTFPKPKK